MCNIRRVETIRSGLSNGITTQKDKILGEYGPLRFYTASITREEWGNRVKGEAVA